MNRLQSELHRLYFSGPPDRAEDDVPSPVLIDARGRVRAMVISLTRPANWQVLAKVWHGVQAELDLPAPAIAVSGVDALQLWFSLAEAVAVPQAHAFVESLRLRFLPEVKAARVGLWPDSAASAQRPELHVRVVPAQQEERGNWSAFVAPDLAPVFDDTPWLDIAPNEEGQATLLRGLVSMTPAAFEAALGRGSGALGDRLGSARHQLPAVPIDTTRIEAAPAPDATATEAVDARRFLLRVMNDDTVELALRVEAAKALLR